MKPFAFLRKTSPSAKQNNYGQFNGYIAFDSQEIFNLGLAWVEYDIDGCFEQYVMIRDIYKAAPSEITYMGEHKFHEIGSIYPISEIPQEAIDKTLFVIGFDTCHIDNSWDKDTYDSVKSETIEWLAKVIDIYEFYVKAMKEEEL